jgi:DNA-binding response OmpR family regulator
MGTFILLVEDDADLGSVLEEVISLRGYRTRLCTTGSEARSTFADERPALVILDWGLPDCDPEQLAEEFTSAGVPVVLASGTEHTGMLAERIHAVAVLDKPYAIEDVFRVLEDVLGPPAPAAPGP